MQDNGDSDGGSTSTALYGMDGIFGIDEAFPETDRFPAALIRGENFYGGSLDGVFALNASIALLLTGGFCFRCARPFNIK